MKISRPRRRGLAAAITLSAAVLATASSGLAAPARGPARRPAPQSFTKTIEGRDISGVWMLDNYVGSGAPIDRRILKDMDGKPVPAQPWAQKLYDERVAAEREGHTFPGPPTFCLPHGMPQMLWAAAYPVQILQTPGQVSFIHELARQYRLVYLDRKHKPDPDNNFYGDSVGHWEGDTLVVDTIGLSAKNTLDMLGMPTSDRMHLIEHIRRPTHDKLQIDITVDDPGVFTKPWTRRVIYSLQPRAIEVTEYICLESNRNTVVDGKVTIDGQPRGGGR